MSTNANPPKISLAEKRLPQAAPPISEPEIRISQAVSIQIVSDSQEADYPCPFWVGLMSQGVLSPGSLLDFQETSAILTKASTQGVVEKNPVMLSDSRSAPPRHIYLVPKPSGDFRQDATWVRDLVKTVSDWSPEQIGIYIAPSLISNDLSHNLLLNILRELISLRAASQFFLYTGDYGFHSVLNAALKLKMELADEPKAPPILIYH
jgi:hypothetical protein